MIYLLSALIFPSIWIGETAVRFELVYSLWLILAIILHKAVSKSTFRWHPILTMYMFFLVTVALSTTLALVNDPSKGSMLQLAVSFYGILRPLLVMFIFLNISFDEMFPWRTLRAFVWASIPIAILSFGQTVGSSAALQVTLLGYTSPSRAPVFNLLKEHDTILRSTGVFESPVFNAVYFLMVLTTVGFALVTGVSALGNKWFLYTILGLAAVAGITTLSTTFLLGAVLMLLLLVFLLSYRYPKRFLQLVISSLFIVSLFIIISWPYFTQQPIFIGALNYQIDKILSGSLFNTRYDPENGIFQKTYEAIQQRPLLGWGLTQSEGVFVGDSIYISIFYKSGILGLNIFFLMIYVIFRHAWRSRNIAGLHGKFSWVILLWTFLLLNTGFGSPSFFIIRLQEWYWALVGMSLGINFTLRKKNIMKHKPNNEGAAP